MSPVKTNTLNNTAYHPYLTTNVYSALGKPVTVNGKTKKHLYPKVGIYNGPGASHSWIWFVDILDAMGFWDIEFVDNQQIRNGELTNVHVLLVSGGDTFAIAESLGKEGAKNIKYFLEEGGLYIGSCAGAYLPLNSSLSPLNLFNFASVKISNLAHTLPAPVTLPEKFCTSYGCHYVFHPVREEVKFSLVDSPFPQQNVELVAPLYGGPSFLPSPDVHTLALYTGFTPKTLFLTDVQLAYDTVIGKSAIVTRSIGKGMMCLLGPHLEHPHYPIANTLIAEMIYHGTSNEAAKRKTDFLLSTSSPHHGEAHTLLRGIKGELSNARVVALSLERVPIHWYIGHKVYEPEKIRVFLEAMWRRWSTFASHRSGNEPELYAIYTMAKALTKHLRTIKQSSCSGTDDPETIGKMFNSLKALTASFLTLYFRKQRILTMKGGIP